MRIGGSREGRFGHGGQRPRETSAAEPSRALTVVSAASARDSSLLTRGNAAFLAHLIATNAQAPQTRMKRRATPAEAIAAYRATADLVRPH